MKRLPGIVYKIINEEAKKLNIIVEEVLWEKEANKDFLRIIADTEDGLSIEDSTKLNEAIGLRLDEADPIEGEYYLEVSSPGLERPLKKEEDFLRFIGSYIYFKTYSAIDKRKEFYGTLRAYTKEAITVAIIEKTKEKLMEIKHSQISQIRLAIKF